VNWKRASSLAAPDRFGQSSPFTIRPRRTYYDESATATSLFSSTWQKSAQLTDSMGFQVPVFCVTCALFPWKSSVFNILTKTPCVICAPVLTKFSKRRRYEGTDSALKGRRYMRRYGTATATEKGESESRSLTADRQRRATGFGMTPMATEPIGRLALPGQGCRLEGGATTPRMPP
jgi:hypothetical protein